MVVLQQFGQESCVDMCLVAAFITFVDMGQNRVDLDGGSVELDARCHRVERRGDIDLPSDLFFLDTSSDAIL